MKNTTLNIRTNDRTKHLLQQAARMLGITVSGFLLNSATEKAHEIIQNQIHFAIDDEKWDIFCKELDQDPSQNPKLKSLLASKSVFLE